MIVQEQKFQVERSNDFQEKAFSIKSSAKAFKILSSGVYSNKIRACIREYCTNGYDSQVAAGKDNIPLLVHLPNQLESWFSVRDYGTGLSHNDVQTIYTTYFESTKNNSNDFVGTLGIGSKSGFCLVDTFGVTSYFNGTKSIYAAFINENGCPSIALMHQEETTEPNGLEVSFAVKSSDFNKFKEEAEFVFRYFKVRPTIVGQQITFKEDNVVQSGSDWKLVSNGEHGVIMGGIFYPFSTYDVNVNNSIFNRFNIIIEVPIGAVQITASRESLEFTETTKSAVKKRIDECIANFKAGMQAQLDACATLWDATVFYAENSIFIGSALWNGVAISSAIKLNKAYFGTKISKSYYNNSSYKVSKNREISWIKPADHHIYVVNDCKGAVDRVKALLKTVKNDHAFLINFEDGAQAEFEQTIGQVPVGTYILASSLPKVVRNYVKGGATNSQTLTFVRDRSKATSSWVAEEIDFADGGVYVEVDHWTPTEFSSHANLSDILGVLETLKAETEVIGIRKKSLPKVADNQAWESLTDYIKGVLDNNKNDFEFAVSLDNYANYNSLLKLKGCLNGLPVSGLINRIQYAKDNYKKLSALRRLMYQAKIFDTIKETDVEAEVRTVMTKYPLVKFIIDKVSIYDTLPADAIASYIRSVDSKSANDEIF